LHRENLIPPKVVPKRTLLDSDVASLRKKFQFLEGFSDSFISSTPLADLMKMESTSLKIRELDRAKDAEDKLASNKSALADSYTCLEAGKDNRWDSLHTGRFLGGAGCSSKKVWLAARKFIGLSGIPPISSYDMGSVGLAGFVSAKGWVEVHNPASCKISIKQFNINSCSARQSKDSKGDDSEFIQELGEFKLALRALRTAVHFVHPWNHSVLALEGFFLQNNFCLSDLASIDKKAMVLTRFSDYILGQNAERWRDSEPFLSTGDLKSTWAAFWGAQPQAALSQKKKEKPKLSGSQEARRALLICFAFNMGQCSKPANNCVTARGVKLRHICDHVADPNKPAEVCGKDHPRKDHK